MIKFTIFFISTLLIYSCSNEQQTDKQLTVSSTKTKNVQQDSDLTLTENSPDTLTIESNQRVANSNQDFLTFYHKFSTAISNKDITSFNDCIYTDYGLYIIEAQGAMPVVSKVYDVSVFKSKSGNKSLLDLNFKNIIKEPVFDQLPKVICDIEIYDKQGCFADYYNPFIDNQLWNYAGLNEKEIQAINQIAGLVKITVINTSNHTFYFSNIENKWYISFIDFRIPCEV